MYEAKKHIKSPNFREITQGWWSTYSHLITFIYANLPQSSNLNMHTSRDYEAY